MNNKNGEFRNMADVSLTDVFIILWRWKWIAITISFICVICSTVIALISKPVYESTSKLITKSESSRTTSPLNAIAAIADMGMMNSSPSDPSAYLPEIIKDKEFAERILNKKWFYNEDSVKLESIWRMKTDSSGENQPYEYYKQISDKLRNGGYIRLVRDQQTRLLTLTTAFQTPLLAYSVNLYVIQLLEEYISTKLKSQAIEKKRFIAQRVMEVQNDLEESENNLAMYKKKNIGSSDATVMTGEQRLTRKMMINQELYIQLRKELELARIDDKKDLPLIEIVNNPEIPVFRSKPKRKNIVIAGFGIGLTLGVICSLGLHCITRRNRKKAVD